MKWILPLTLWVLSFQLTACKQNEMDDLAKAQQCLDNVSQDNPAAAEACLPYVEKYTSQQANILKCSIHMTAGGLVESKIVQGYKALKNDAIQNKEAAFMAVLSLDKPTVPEGYTRAVTANEFCQASGIPGLRYISDIIVSGSYMAKTIAALGGPPLDPNNPNLAVAHLVDQCGQASPPAACLTDIATLGASVVSLSDVYCSSNGADASVCDSINATVDSAGSDPARVGRALFCYIENPRKRYDPALDQCI